MGASGVNKVYDGSTNATVNLATDALAGDTVVAHGVAAFASPSVGTGIAVHVASITIDGADAGNYTLSNTSADTTADIITGSATVSLLDPTQLAVTYDGTPKAVGFATVPAGLTLTVTYGGESTVPVGAGTYAVLAAVVDPNYAGNASQSLVISKADQTIDFAALSDKHTSDADFAVSATASSGLPVSFTAVGSCSIADATTTVHIMATSTCTVTAHQAGDTNHNAAPDVSRAFAVTDNTAPVITLIGDATATVTVGSSYTDAGATALDDLDGNVTAHLVVNNSVNTSVVGDYSVTYNVTDASGNAAEQKARTVHVVAAAVVSTGGNTPAPVPAGGNGPIVGSGFGLVGSPVVSLVTGGVVPPAAPTGAVLGAETFHFGKDLRKGMTNPDVTELQNFLTTAGFFKVPATGYFGSVTLASVKAFQKKHSLPTTGFVGPMTRAILNQGQ